MGRILDMKRFDAQCGCSLSDPEADYLYGRPVGHGYVRLFLGEENILGPELVKISLLAERVANQQDFPLVTAFPDGSGKCNGIFGKSFGLALKGIQLELSNDCQRFHCSHYRNCIGVRRSAGNPSDVAPPIPVQPRKNSVPVANSQFTRFYQYIVHAGNDLAGTNTPGLIVEVHI